MKSLMKQNQGKGEQLHEANKKQINEWGCEKVTKTGGCC